MLAFREEDRPDMQVVWEHTWSLLQPIQVAVQARERGDYPKALRVLQKCSAQSGELYLELGRVLTHFGQWGDARTALNQGLTSQPSAILALQLSLALAETHYQVGEWRETAAVCERALSLGKPGWEQLCALYYLANSHNQQKDGQGVGEAHRWSGVLGAHTPKAQALTLLITADRFSIVGNQTKAVEKYEEGLAIARQWLANSYCTACSLCDLARLYETSNSSNAEQLYVEARSLCHCHFPQSLQLPNCLLSLANLYFKTNRLGEAEALLLQAHSLYQEHFPHSIQLVDCLQDLGLLYSDTKRLREAEQHYLEARSLCQSHFPQSSQLADCLQDLALLYKQTKRPRKAEQLYLEARSLYQTHFAQSIHLAECLQSLGLLYSETNRPREEEQLYSEVRRLCEVHFPHSIQLARSLLSLGVLYKNTERPREAEQLLLQARSLYQLHFPQSIELANCLYDLGLLYKGAGRKSEAVASVRAARQLYVSPGDVEDCERLLSSLVKL